jgi:hypothetical protein
MGLTQGDIVNQFDEGECVCVCFCFFVSEVEKGLLSDVASLASLVGLYDG